jgi:hypothetical protein
MVPLRKGDDQCRAARGGGRVPRHDDASIRRVGEICVAGVLRRESCPSSEWASTMS